MRIRAINRRDFLRASAAGLASLQGLARGAAGLAVLKDLGSNSDIMDTKIFDQEQIKGAVELGLGVSGPGEIDFLTEDESSRLYADRLKSILDKG